MLVFRKKKLWWAFCQKGKTELTKMSLKLRKMKINDLKAGPNFFWPYIIYNDSSFLYMLCNKVVSDGFCTQFNSLTMS